VIKEKKYATDAEIEAIGEKIKNRVDEAVKFAEDSPFPEPGEIYHDNYVQADYPYIMD
jgi:pyruvate dehydrogenase E1 component alpha subunit